jgi:anti-sigma B factor antagonist
MAGVKFQHIKTCMVDDVAVVEVLAGELRFPHQARELGDELALVVGQVWASRLVIDMRHTKYLSSTGFAILVGLVKQTRKLNHEIKFCNFDPQVRRFSRPRNFPISPPTFAVDPSKFPGFSAL